MNTCLPARLPVGADAYEDENVRGGGAELVTLSSTSGGDNNRRKPLGEPGDGGERGRLLSGRSLYMYLYGMTGEFGTIDTSGGRLVVVVVVVGCVRGLGLGDLIHRVGDGL
jgi:hypothetical protein